MSARAASPRHGFNSWPAIEFPLTGVTQIAVTDRLGCALLSSGELRCFRLYRETGKHPYAHLMPVSEEDVASFDLGPTHLCTIRHDGSVGCRSWRFGEGKDIELAARRSVPLPAPAKQVAVGVEHSCAVTSDRRLWCWPTSRPPRHAAALSASLTDVEKVSLAGDGGCALRSSGTVTCFGRRFVQRFAPEAPSTGAVALPQVSDARDLDVAAEHGCVLRKSGTALCWGTQHVGRWRAGQSVAPGELRRLPIDEPIARLTTPPWGVCWTSEAGRTHCAARQAPELVGEAVAQTAGGDRLLAVRASGGRITCFGVGEHLSPRTDDAPARGDRRAVIAPSWRVYFGGGARSTAAGSDVTGHLGLRADVLLGASAVPSSGVSRRRKDEDWSDASLRWGVGPMVDVRLASGARRDALLGASAATMLGPMVTVMLSGGLGHAYRGETSEPLFGLDLRLGAHPFYDLILDDGRDIADSRLLFAAPFGIYVAYRAERHGRRWSEITAGLEADPMVWLALLAMPFMG